MNRDTNTRTELYELGKYKLLERLSDGIELSSNTIVGHGHDASAMATNSKLALSASGLMLEGVHFNLTYFPLKHLGYKAVVSVLSPGWSPEHADNTDSRSASRHASARNLFM